MNRQMLNELTTAEVESNADEMRLEAGLRQRQTQLVLKRGVDLAVASLALIALAPAFLIIAFLIRISSSGPMFFRQTRVGYRGKLFVIYKFRTMRHRPEPAILLAQERAAADGVLVKDKDDSRVTAMGKWLRSTSLDEIPQLLNVLKGDMSLVGPRPLLPFMLAACPAFSRCRSLVRPGITGLWQVSERENNTSARAMMPYDLEYIRQFSLSLDAAILARTPRVVLAGAGAW